MKTSPGRSHLPPGERTAPRSGGRVNHVRSYLPGQQPGEPGRAHLVVAGRFLQSLHDLRDALTEPPGGRRDGNSRKVRTAGWRIWEATGPDHPGDRRRGAGPRPEARCSRSPGTSSTTSGRSSTSRPSWRPGPERWRPFWAVRYDLTCGRRVEPLRRMPVWDAPRIVVVVDPTVYETLHEDQRDALDGFLGKTGLTAVGTKDELDAARGGVPPPALLVRARHALSPDARRRGDHPERPRVPAAQPTTATSVPRGCWRSSTPARRARPTRRPVRSWKSSTAPASPARS